MTFDHDRLALFCLLQDPNCSVQLSIDVSLPESLTRWLALEREKRRASD